MEQLKRDMRLALVIHLASAVAIALAYALTWGKAGANTQASDADGMNELYSGYYYCMNEPARTTTCELEYDGDGSSNTPADYHWYWR